MSLSVKEKPSQKTSTTYQKTENQSFNSTSYFFSSFLGCYTHNNRNEARSFNKTNPQKIQNLIDARHYTDRIHKEKQPCLACHQASIKSKVKEITNSSPPNIFERFPDWRILLYGGKVLVARFTLKSAKIHKLPLYSEKRRRISINSSKDGLCLYKEDFHKEEFNNTCTNATYILQSDFSRMSSNPSLASCKGVQQSLDQDFMNFESRIGKLLYRISAHVAKKAANFGNLVLDATSSSGIPCLQFARHGLQVIVPNKTFHFCKILSQNAIFFGLKDKIEIFEADFLDLKLRSIDLVFLAPYVHSSNQDDSNFEEDSFSIFDHIVPDIVTVLCKAFECAKSVVMVLPKKADLSELAMLFWKCNEKRKNLQKIAVKIEYFQVNCKLERYIIYFGEMAEITDAEERGILEKFLLRDYPADFLLKNSHFRVFLESLPPSKIYEIYHERVSDSHFSESLYFQFLWACHHEEKILNKSDYESLIAFERKFKGENKGSFCKTTMLTERTNNESLMPKLMAQSTAEVLTFSGSREKSQLDIKIISPESPLKQSPFFKAGSSSMQKLKITVEKEIDRFESELSDSSLDEQIPPSNYSGQIQNSFSPPSDRAKFRTIITPPNYSFAEKRSELKIEAEIPINLVKDTEENSGAETSERRRGN